MKRTVFNAALTFALFLGLLMTTSVNAQEPELVVIGNLESVPPEMDIDQLRMILKGERKQWDDGRRVVVALMKTKTVVGAETCNRLYNMTVNEFRKHFALLEFQGKGKPPTYCNSIDEMEAFVAETPGAIGVIESTSSKLVQVILVDGKLKI